VSWIVSSIKTEVETFKPDYHSAVKNRYTPISPFITRILPFNILFFMVQAVVATFAPKTKNIKQFNF